MMANIQPVMFFLQHEGAENTDMMTQLVQTNIFSFLIAAIALVIIVKKFNLGSILDQRQAAIVKSLKEAEEKRDQALKDLKSLEERTAKLSSEVTNMISDAQKTAEAVADSIIKSAEDDAAKLLANAQKRIEQEEKTAARELEQRLMQEALHGARQLLENTLSADDKHDSIKQFVEQLPTLAKEAH